MAKPAASISETERFSHKTIYFKFILFKKLEVYLSKFFFIIINFSSIVSLLCLEHETLLSLIPTWNNLAALRYLSPFNELLLYVFTGFFLLMIYDNIYKLGKNSY